MPHYLYHLPLLRHTVRAAKSAAGDAVIHFAVKACADPRVLAVIASEDLGADCVSIGEVRTAVCAGILPSRIVLAGVGKRDEEIREALRLGIFAFHAESREELSRLAAIADELHTVAPVCLRLNPEVDAHTHEKITTGRKENKFGIPLELLPACLEVCQREGSLRLMGLHFHIGSQILDMAPFVDLAERVNGIVASLAEANGGAVPTWLQHVNVGGGLGVDYDAPLAHPVPDFAAYFSAYRETLRLPEGCTLHVELGRSLVAQCGSLITEVVDVKQGVDKTFCIVDAGMNDLVRPAMYGALHQVVPYINIWSVPHVGKAAGEEPVAATETYDVVGPICESSDVFAEAYALPPVKRGDKLALLSAGAYGETMASTYNGRKLVRAEYVEESAIPQKERDRQEYVGLVRALVHRDGVERLIAWLEDPRCDFFEAPSSTNYHLNVAGGLCRHSLNVFHTLRRLCEEVYEPSLSSPDTPWTKPLPLESIAIVALFHDFCKINLYHETEKYYKDGQGRWQTYKGYEVKDNFPLGHGEKSIYRITRFIHLTDDELLAIRWHMGMYDVPSYGQSGFYSLREAMGRSPLVALLQSADALSSNVLEITTDPKKG